MSIPADFGPDSGGRVKGLTIVKPIVYGNVARYFGKKREDDGHTHEWTVYVKPYNNEDMSNYVKKVHFKLHESYTNPNRMVTKPPYEVKETGWGEFEIVIKIYFHDPNERPLLGIFNMQTVSAKPLKRIDDALAGGIITSDFQNRLTTMYHILKLFQSPIVEGNTSAASGGKKGLVSENYEEIVFQEPSQLMQHLLTNVKLITLGPWTHDTDFEDKKEKTLEKIINAKTKVRTEIAELKDKLKLAKETILKFKDEISKQQANQMSNMMSL